MRHKGSLSTKPGTDTEVHTGHFYFAKKGTFLVCVDSFQFFVEQSTFAW